MEIDILNDILTKTVSNLFSNKIKHNSYLTLEDDESGISDISFTNSAPSQDREIDHSKLQNQTQNLSQHNHQQLQQQKPKQESICTPELWKTTIGKKKYEEAMKRLDLDDKKIKSKVYLNQPLEFLNQEKSKIKNELKKYDNDFFEVFQQMPNRSEKEIMKPLYIYYKTLKSAINQKIANANNHNTPSSSNITAMNTNTDINGNNINKAHTTAGQGLKIGHSSNYSQNYVSITNNTINPSHTFTHHQQQQQQHQHYVNNGANTISFKNMNHKKANSASQAQNEGELLENNNNTFSNVNKKPQERKRALSKEEIMILEKEYYNIKKEQNDLKQKLHRYQTDFQTNNNRKVKFVKDITPVKREYDKYKTNKNKLKEIKEALTDCDKK